MSDFGSQRGRDPVLGSWRARRHGAEQPCIGLLADSLSNSLLDRALTGGYTGNGNIAPTSPGVVSQYCNGSRIPPENGGLGYSVPAGVADNDAAEPGVQPETVRNRGRRQQLGQPGIWSADVDESLRCSAGQLCAHGDFGSDQHSHLERCTEPRLLRHNPAAEWRVRHGAVEFAGTIVAAPAASVTGGPLAFGNVVVGTTSNSQTLTLHNTGNANLTGITLYVLVAAILTSGGIGRRDLRCNPDAGSGNMHDQRRILADCDRSVERNADYHCQRFRHRVAGRPHGNGGCDSD